jgi:hypothetical protein
MEGDHITDTVDSAAQDRKARFGRLPERIPFAAMAEEQRSALRNLAGDEYYAEHSWQQAPCIALDAGI